MILQTALFRYLILVLVALSLISCSQDSSGSSEQTTIEKATNQERNFDAEQIKRGRQLYLKNCTVCHGIYAEGATDWQQRNADGTFPAPPLNGTGHAWHHPHKALVDTIKHGTIRLDGNMPPWKDRLSDQEINDIIIWFQSKWPDELYQAWQRIDKKAQQR